MNLNIIQAEYGDCMILEFGSALQDDKRHYFLIDGGPASTYAAHLKKELQNIKAKRGKLDLLIVSHIDNDHINGLLNMMAELQAQRNDNAEETIDIEALWYNAFGQTIGKGNDIEHRLNNILSRTRGIDSTIGNTTTTVTRGIREGQDLNRYAQDLGIPINPNFNYDTLTVDDIPDQLKFDDLSLHVVGPTKKNLDELKKMWIDWLDKYEGSILHRDSRIAIQADRSIPNLSSIMFIAEENGKRILLTGDGLGDHLLQGLKQSNMLDSKGSMHVDVLKIPHHGSERNVTKDFFEAITADKYVICANGRDDNPSLSTLTWIAENAKEQRRPIEIVLTNNTPNVEQFIKELPQEDYGYKLTIMDKEANSINLKIE
jgi:Metallo-beta-lactamase superfamily